MVDDVLASEPSPQFRHVAASSTARAVLPKCAERVFPVRSGFDSSRRAARPTARKRARCVAACSRGRHHRAYSCRTHRRISLVEATITGHAGHTSPDDRSDRILLRLEQAKHDQSPDARRRSRAGAGSG